MEPKEVIGKARDIIDDILSYQLPPGWRKKIAYGIVALAMAVGYLLSLTPPPKIELGTRLAMERASIEMKSGKAHEFELEIAKTPTDLEIGLMFRKKMDKDHGMMFQMGRDPKPVSFWMKNTYIPLDIIFVASDGTIVNIRRNAIPQSLDPIPSIEPVTGVIELNGGRTEDIGINIGDKVTHRYFHTQK